MLIKSSISLPVEEKYRGAERGGREGLDVRFCRAPPSYGSRLEILWRLRREIWRLFSDALPSPERTESGSRESSRDQSVLRYRESKLISNHRNNRARSAERSNGFLNDPAITGSWVCERRRSRREERGEKTDNARKDKVADRSRASYLPVAASARFKLSAVVYRTGGPEPE